MTSSAAREHIHLVETAWRRMRTAVDELGPHGLDLETPAGWTVKEMLAHLCFWDETSVPVIIGMFRGEDVPSEWAFGSGYVPSEGEEWPRADVHNAREAEWARTKTSTEVIERWDKAHAWVLWVLSSVTDEEAASEKFQRYLSELPGRYVEHFAELEALGARSAVES